MKIESFHQLDEIEQNFIKTINQLIQQYPFKWFNLMELIFNYKNIYIKDSTMFIELIYLKEEELKRLFEIFKKLFNKRIIEKIIYKREFMIISFHSEFITSFFKSENKWLTIPLYAGLTKINIITYYDVKINNNKYYLGAIINQRLVTIDHKHHEPINSIHLPLIINLYSNKNEYLLFSFNLERYLNNLFCKLNLGFKE